MVEGIVLVLVLALAGLGAYTWRLRAANQQQRMVESNLQSMLTAQEAALTQVRQEFATSEQQVAALTKERSHNQTLIEDLRKSTAEQEQRAAALDAQIQEARNACTELQKQIDSLQSENARLREVLAEQERDAIYKRALTLTLANASYDGLIVVDKDFRIIAINDTAEMIFDVVRPVGELLLNVTDLPELEMMVQDALRHEEESFEEQVNINDQNYRVKARVIRRDGHMFIGLALQDITRLVKLNRARRDMVANISHELRHPIANIRLTIDSLFHEQDKPKRKDSISSLRAIARETDALMWLVQEMSDLAMIESGQAIVRMIDTPLNEMVDDALERISEQLQQKNIRVIRSIPASLNVLCDRDLTQRVIINLLHNALKWTPKEGTITVSADHDEDEVRISVFDTGPGVPDDQVDRIFERFYQVDASRSGGEGTGLGLAICRHIVQAHGGRIWAEGNSEGKGGRFQFTLMAAENQPEEA
jgi:two-component system, OmpR family, phosphate regulon sensor histidine kinase PhoR